MKVMTIVGTRPEIIKLSRIIAELDQHTTHLLVHSGQNYDYELNEIFFQQLGICKPDYFLDAAGDTAAQTIGNVIAKADELLAKELPDALLLLGDTNSCLSVIAAKGARYRFFTWRPATVASISGCRKRSTARSWIIPATST